MIKRDIRYFIKKILIGVGIIFVMSFIKSCNVHAETLEITANTTINNYNLPVYYVLQNNGNLILKYQDYHFYSGTPFNSNFGYMSVCATGNFEVNNNSADCSDGCFNNSFPVVNLGTSCNFTSGSTSFNGYRYYIFYSVKTWGSINAGTLPIVYDTITFKNKTSQNIQMGFESNFISNEDVYNEYAGSNRIAELQEQTNRIIQESNQSVINNQNTNTQSIINNQNQNAQDIMNNDTINTDIVMQNDNQNTQNIINNQNTNTQQQIDSQKVCKPVIFNDTYDYTGFLENVYLSSDGNLINFNGYRVSTYIEGVKSIVRSNTSSSDVGNRLCFYNENKTLISCYSTYGNINIPIPENTYYVRFNQGVANYRPIYTMEICQNGNQALNDAINDDNISGAESEVNDLLNNDTFQDNSGIQSIITAPLNFIQGLTNTCSPITLTIPFIDTNVSIPCMKQELTNRVPTVVPILSTIINGFIIYRILLDIVGIVKSAREPDEDRIEVLDL